MAVDFEKSGQSIKTQIVHIYTKWTDYIGKIMDDGYKEMSCEAVHGATKMLMMVMHDILDEDDDDDNG